MQLIFRNPIGVNVELYYGIMGEENLRKERLLNKLKGVGTCLDGYEKWEDYYVIFPKVIKYL